MQAGAEHVNVVVLSHNKRDYLDAALQSVLSQTHEDLHVIVVDDASTDGAADLARQYEQRHPDQVTAICNRRRGGVGRTADQAMAAGASAPFIASLAHDDLWAPNKLEIQLAEFRGSPQVGLVFTEAELIDEEGAPLGETFSNVFGSPRLEEPAREIFERGNFICGSSVMVRREAMDLLRFPGPYDLVGDLFMWMVIAAYFDVRYVQAPLTLYRRSPDSVSSTREEELVRELYSVRVAALRRYPRLVDVVGSEAARDWLDDYILEHSAVSVRQGNYDRFRWSTRVLFGERLSPRNLARYLYLTLRHASARLVELFREKSRRSPSGVPSRAYGRSE
jgi:glycosyltransferase involved in cell wall biosynthesis